MAISLHTAGSWVAANATTQTVTLPTHSTGDMLIVRVGFKHATMPTTVTVGTAGWTKLGETNGTGGASSNGGGGVQVAVFYKEAASAAETNPVVTFNGGAVAATPSAAVAMAYQKAAGETWETPVGAGTAIAAATSISESIDSHISVTAGDLVDEFHVTNDNTTLTVPTFTQTGVTYAAVTESPATALSSATSNDISADGCYRGANSGTSSAAATITGTNSVADVGAGWTTRLRVSANQLVTPTTAALVLTTFAPVVTLTGPITFRGAGTLQASSTDTAVISFPYPAGAAAGDVAYLFAQGSSAGDTDITDPSGWTRIGSRFREIGANDMELYVWRKVLAGSDAEPTITVDTAHSGTSLGVFGFIAAWIGVDNTTPEDATTVFSDSAAAATWAPTGITTASANAQAVSIVVTDDDNALAFASGGSADFIDRASGTSYHSTTGGDTAFGLAERLAQSAGSVTQPTWEQTLVGTDAWIGAALALRAAVDAGDVTVTPTTASLVLTTFAPTVTASDHQTVTPTTAALTLTTFAPNVTLGFNVVPPTAALVLTTFAPTVSVTDNQTVTPTTAGLVLTTFAPTVTASDHKLVTPDAATLALTTFAPTVTASDHKVVTPTTAALILTAFAPTVTAGGGLTLTPDTASLILTTFAPTVSVTNHQLVTPTTASLVLTTFAPTVTGGSGAVERAHFVSWIQDDLG